ncbi:MAG: major capsid protein [Rhodospirillales bacterium]|jgi:hypothetical protein
MNLYSTTALTAVVSNLILPQSFFLDRFFTSVIQSTTEDIKIDIDKGKRRISPFVSPLVQGKIVASRGFTTQTFTPAYVKDKRVFQPNRALKRALGEAIGGVMTPAERVQLNLVNDLADQTQMLQRRQEVMAAQALTTGHVIVSGDGYDTVDVDFQRDAALTFALTGGAKWDQAGTDPLADIEEWALLVLKKSGATVIDVVMDPDAWTVFRSNSAVQDEVKRLATAGATPLELGNQVKPGARFMGSLRGMNFWVYADWYIDDTGAEVPMLASGTVVLSGPQIEGRRYYGAIQDEAAGLQALPYFVKSWVEDDPALRLLMMQSAPLPAPFRPDASLCATVK